ncbi:Lrp/AsnC family transcriptional regulator [Candidatus Micrarchaeota archaeon]|nr:Lrp/AsnC family transcriptional regulator [Candidatus Micrarchaeota archaeon]
MKKINNHKRIIAKENNSLDKLDIRIIKMLIDNPKISIKKIAYSTRRSVQVVSYRLNRLIENKTIRSFSTIINMNYLGFEHYRLFFKLKKVDPISVRKVREFIESGWGVYNISTLGGKYDLYIAIYVKNYIDYDNFIDLCYTHFPNIMGEIEDVYVKNHYIYPIKYLSPKSLLKNKIISIPVSYETVKIDDVDKLILKYISQNCRLTSTELANITKLSYKTILYRIKKLEDRGIIKGYKTFINDKLHKSYFILFSLRYYYKETEQKMFNYLATHPLVDEATKQFGAWGVMVHLYAKNENEIKMFINQFREKFENIKDYEILPIISSDYVNMFPYY